MAVKGGIKVGTTTIKKGGSVASYNNSSSSSSSGSSNKRRSRGGGKGGSNTTQTAAPNPAPTDQDLYAALADYADDQAKFNANEAALNDIISSEADSQGIDIGQDLNKANSQSSSNAASEYENMASDLNAQADAAAPAEDVVVGDQGGNGGNGGNAAPLEETEVTGTDTVAATPTEQDAWLAAQGAMGVDATKRRRRRAGYQGTILTGMGGQQESNLGRTSLLGG